MAAFTGVWPALVTPLTADGEIDCAAAESLIEDTIACGIGGLYVCGGTGEGVLLSPERRRTTAEVAIGAAAGRVPVMVHVGAIDTAGARELAKHATAAGADAVSAVPPFYYGYSFDAIKQHYAAITAAAGVPLYLYYIPGATGAAVTPEQLLEICALDGVAGFKYTSHDLYYLSQVMAMRDPEQVNILSGPDQLFLPCLSLGVDGCIGTTYNFQPRLYIDIMGACLGGDLVTARRLQFGANAVIKVLADYGVIPATKALLGMLGHDVGCGVPPMPPVVGEQADALKEDLIAAGFWGLLRRHALYGPEGDPMRGTLA